MNKGCRLNRKPLFFIYIFIHNFNLKTIENFCIKLYNFLIQNRYIKYLRNINYERVGNIRDSGLFYNMHTFDFINHNTEGLFSSAQANVLGSQRGDALTKATKVLSTVFILGALLISMAISAQKTAFDNVSDTLSRDLSDNTSINTDEEKKALEENLGENITVDTVPEGFVLRLGDILFNTDSYVLRDEAKETIDRIINVINRSYSGREIIIQGHTDNVGEAEYNQTLSKNRAKVVADYIMSNLQSNKISYNGYGDKNPIASNDTEEGRRKNRRVDIIIKLR